MYCQGIVFNLMKKRIAKQGFLFHQIWAASSKVNPRRWDKKAFKSAIWIGRAHRCFNLVDQAIWPK